MKLKLIQKYLPTALGWNHRFCNLTERFSLRLIKNEIKQKNVINFTSRQLCVSYFRPLSQYFNRKTSYQSRLLDLGSIRVNNPFWVQQFFQQPIDVPYQVKNSIFQYINFNQLFKVWYWLWINRNFRLLIKFLIQLMKSVSKSIF